MDPVSVAKTAQLAITLARSRKVRAVVIGVLICQLLIVGAAVYAQSAFMASMSGQAEKRRLAATDDSCDFEDTGGATVSTTAKSFRGMSNEQLKNATTIWQVAHKMGMGDQGAVVGIATAMQESTLRNINYGDRDSLGLFQQRPSMGWGSAKQVTDPVYASTKFFKVLKGVKGWRSLPVTVAAQRVQRSAFPNAYAKHERTARALVNLFTSKKGSTATAADLESEEGQAAVASGMCAGDGGAGAANCPATGWGVEAGLTPDALRVLRCAHKGWASLSSFGGVGDRPSNVDRDHQEGRAVDIMIPNYRGAAGKAMGKVIAEWARKNARQLGVKYVIWNAHIWSVQRNSEGWRKCGTSAAGCYGGSNDTAAHRDHVHVSVYGNAATGEKGGGGTGSVVRPLSSYTLTARFGQCSSKWLSCHTGLDFAAPTGANIKAVTDCTITYAGWAGRYGNLTKCRASNGTESWYAHQSRIGVRVGDRVQAGQHIGDVGATGNAFGSHLHLEIRVGGRAVNPQPWLAARGARP